MIEINTKKIDIWSKVGSRATFGLAILEIEKNFNLLAQNSLEPFFVFLCCIGVCNVQPVQKQQIAGPCCEEMQ